MIPTLLEIPVPGLGTLPIHSFGLMMVLGFLAALRRLQLSLASAGEDPLLGEQMLTWAAIGGIVGARLGYIASYPGEFMRDPLGTLFAGAGFVFYGGFLGGAFAVWWLLRRREKDFWAMSDLTAPALAVGYAVGRVGCQLSGDGDYGRESDLPWAMGYPDGVVPTPAGMLVHPAPVYETFGALLIALILISPRVSRKLSGRGQLFGLYLALSAAARFAVEGVRIEPRIFAGLTQAQLFAIAIFGCGSALLLNAAQRHRRNHAVN